MSTISVILPMYRTGAFVEELYRRLVAALESTSNPFELIMVDDGSPDDAWTQITKLARKDHRVKAIQLSRNFGQHPAIIAGFEHASGDVVVLMDADLQDRPEDIPTLLNHLTSDIDIVYTIRVGDSRPFLIRLLSKYYHAILGWLTNHREPRNIGTFRAFARHVMIAVLDHPERSILIGPLMFSLGFRSVHVGVQDDPRKGRSSYSLRKRIALAINSIVSYTDLPHRFLVWFGSLVLTATMGYAVVIVLAYFFVRTPTPSGLVLLAMLILLSLGATTIGIGLIGIYVFRVYSEVLHRPRFIVARKLNLSNEATQT